METNEIFALGLGVAGQWKVVKSELKTGTGGGLWLWLDFGVGQRFGCPECGSECGVHDTLVRRWRHLNFWQHETWLEARVPRVCCKEHGVRQVEVPWARAGSGFTLLLEAYVMLLCQQMPVNAVGDLLGEEDTRLWRVVRHYVEKAQADRDWSGVRRVLVDETSAKRGHRYVTNFVDAQSRELLCMVEGRGAEALGSFAKELQAHGGEVGQVEWLCMDMSPAYRKGAGEYFPQARVVFDRFHLMQMAGKALDEVRQEIRRTGVPMEGALWALRGNAWTRSEEQLAVRRAMCRQYPKLGRAMVLRETLAEVLTEEDESGLRWWCQRAMRSRLEPFKKLARSIREHWDGVVGFLETRLTNGLIEAINGLLQLAKRMARGFRSFANFQTMAYLKAAKLKLDLPTTQST